MKRTNSSSLFRLDMHVFYKYLIDHLRKHTSEDINKIQRGAFEEIYKSFRKTPGTTSSVKLSTLMDHYYEKIKSYSGTRDHRVQQLENWYKSEWKDSEETESEQKKQKQEMCVRKSSTSKNTIFDFTQPDSLTAKVFYNKEFCLINCLFNDAAKVLMRAAKDLILAHDGTLIDEGELDNKVHPNCFVINFGPLLDEVKEFLKLHPYDLYKPSLVFSSVHFGKFVIASSFLSLKLSTLKNQASELETNNEVWWDVKSSKSSESYKSEVFCDEQTQTDDKTLSDQLWKKHTREPFDKTTQTEIEEMSNKLSQTDEQAVLEQGTQTEGNFLCERTTQTSGDNNQDN